MDYFPYFTFVPFIFHEKKSGIQKVIFFRQITLFVFDFTNQRLFTRKVTAVYNRKSTVDIYCVLNIPLWLWKFIFAKATFQV